MTLSRRRSKTYDNFGYIDCGVWDFLTKVCTAVGAEVTIEGIKHAKQESKAVVGPSRGVGCVCEHPVCGLKVWCSTSK